MARGYVENSKRYNWIVTLTFACHADAVFPLRDELMLHVREVVVCPSELSVDQL